MLKTKLKAVGHIYQGITNSLMPCSNGLDNLCARMDIYMETHLWPPQYLQILGLPVIATVIAIVSFRQ
jgi:hypothetical protein